MPLLKNRVWSRETTICCEASISPQVGGDGDTQLVIDKTTTQLKCLLEQLVNLVQHDDHVIQSDNDVTKRRQVSTTTILCVVMIYCIVLQNGSHQHNGLLTHANIIINDSLQHFKSHPLQLS